MTKKPQTRSGATDRDDRLKAALKQNLARRKAQARARGAEPQGKEGASRNKDA